MYTNTRGIRARAAIALLLLVGARTLGAQVTAHGRIEGQVYDSIHARPLAQANVQLAGTSVEPHSFRSVFSDETGRFRFDSLPAGRYLISFAAPVLDSLDVMLPDQEVLLGDGERRSLVLVTPSSATLRRAACPGLVLGPGRGAVVGVVNDATTERPLASATIVVGWADLTVDKATLRPVRQVRTGSVTADSLGAYRLCGVPTDNMLTLQVQQGGAAGSPIEVAVDDTIGVLRRDLSFSRADTAVDVVDTAVVRTDTTSRKLASGTAILSGVVTGPDDRPLGEVQLRVVGARAVTFSDGQGRFTLTGLPAGTQMLEARRIGYEMGRLTVDLRGERTVLQAVKLGRIVSLDSVRVIAQRSRYPHFERDRKNGWGHYLDELDILRRNPSRTADLVRMMPGFRVVPNGFDDVIVSTRGATGLQRGSCPMNIIIDGMQHMEIDMVHPSDIAGFEAYSSNVGVPIEYASSSPCGAIVIWTKR